MAEVDINCIKDLLLKIVSKNSRLDILDLCRDDKLLNSVISVFDKDLKKIVSTPRKKTELLQRCLIKGYTESFKTLVRNSSPDELKQHNLRGKRSIISSLGKNKEAFDYILYQYVPDTLKDDKYRKDTIAFLMSILRTHSDRIDSTVSKPWFEPELLLKTNGKGWNFVIRCYYITGELRFFTNNEEMRKILFCGRNEKNSETIFNAVLRDDKKKFSNKDEEILKLIDSPYFEPSLLMANGVSLLTKLGKDHFNLIKQIIDCPKITGDDLLEMDNFLLSIKDVDCLSLKDNPKVKSILIKYRCELFTHWLKDILQDECCEEIIDDINIFELMFDLMDETDFNTVKNGNSCLRVIIEEGINNRCDNLLNGFLKMYFGKGYKIIDSNIKPIVINGLKRYYDSANRFHENYESDLEDEDYDDEIIDDDDFDEDFGESCGCDEECECEDDISCEDDEECECEDDEEEECECDDEEEECEDVSEDIVDLNANLFGISNDSEGNDGNDGNNELVENSGESIEDSPCSTETIQENEHASITETPIEISEAGEEEEEVTTLTNLKLLISHLGLLTENKTLSTCRICLEYTTNVVFIPCGHLACLICSTIIDKCHLCRDDINGKQMIYL